MKETYGCIFVCAACLDIYFKLLTVILIPVDEWKGWASWQR